MKKSKITLLINEFKDLMEKMLVDDGELSPTIGIIAQKQEAKHETERDHLMICPLPDRLLETRDSKAFLMEDILPKLGDKLTKDKFTVVGSIFAYVGLVRTVPTDKLDGKSVEEVTEDDIKSVKPKEILFLHYQSEDDNIVNAFNIARKGKAVNAEGNLVDIVTLTKNSKMSAKTTDPVVIGGSLSAVYKQITKNVK